MICYLLLLCVAASSVESFFQGNSSFSYGKHFPDGEKVLDYMIGPDGPWKQIDKLEYIWNYYAQYATANHPFNKSQLIAYADGTHTTTARDANGYLLWDLNHDLEVDNTSDYGSAFCEHSGTRWIGDSGNTQGAFTNFWFDDNLLASYATQAWGVQSPSGLTSQSGYVRWRVVSGDSSDWTPYASPNSYPDQLALNGLYYLAKGDVASAQSTWESLMGASALNPVYNQNNQEYQYTVVDRYYLGLAKILTDFLAIATNDTNQDLTQHSVSLRSTIMYIIANQTQEGNHLINTETMSTMLLGLGAGAIATYEAHTKLQNNDNSYFYRPYHVLSAVDEVGLSTPGYLSYGPYASYPVGSYLVDFFVRAHNPPAGEKILTIEVVVDDNYFAQRDLYGSAEFISDRWTMFTLNLDITPDMPTDNYQFRTNWPGACNVDLSFIRVRSANETIGVAPPTVTTGSVSTTSTGSSNSTTGQALSSSSTGQASSSSSTGQASSSSSTGPELSTSSTSANETSVGSRSAPFAVLVTLVAMFFVLNL